MKIYYIKFENGYDSDDYENYKTWISNDAYYSKLNAAYYLRSNDYVPVPRSDENVPTVWKKSMGMVRDDPDDDYSYEEFYWGTIIEMEVKGDDSYVY